ncbi:MAG: hypothetical protein GY805_27370, partial [Chloroflexi bacterium]|nr:hypothetical protein [Chloroflexota bacterium]
MIPDLGFVALILALATAVYSAVAAFYGRSSQQPRWVESARNATLAT